MGLWYDKDINNIRGGLVMPENATTNESNHVTLILRELSDDEKMKYITEMREKSLHDEATAINTAKERGRKAIEAEIAEKLRESGMTEEQINSILKL